MRRIITKTVCTALAVILLLWAALFCYNYSYRRTEDYYARRIKAAQTWYPNEDYGDYYVAIGYCSDGSRPPINLFGRKKYIPLPNGYRADGGRRILHFDTEMIVGPFLHLNIYGDLLILTDVYFGISVWDTLVHEEVAEGTSAYETAVAALHTNSAISIFDNK